METTTKLHPGQKFAPVTFPRIGGEPATFGSPGSWQALFVYRGKHCPICKDYLGKISHRIEKFAKLNISVAAVSADSEAQVRETVEAVKPDFPVLFGMDAPMMQRLGLYISEPRSAAETDHRFAEPALFVVNPEGVLQIVDVSNAPFVRPDLDVLLAGMNFIIEKSYPVRGTYR